MDNKPGYIHKQVHKAFQVQCVFPKEGSFPRLHARALGSERQGDYSEYADRTQDISVHERPPENAQR